MRDELNPFGKIAERVSLRQKFKNETGIDWENSQGEPDIDYVIWLEYFLVNNVNIKESSHD